MSEKQLTPIQKAIEMIKIEIGEHSPTYQLGMFKAIEIIKLFQSDERKTIEDAYESTKIGSKVDDRNATISWVMTGKDYFEQTYKTEK